MASMGFPVISVEPVQQHIDTIKGSMAINPSFQIDLYHNGLAIEERQIRANFGHGNFHIYNNHFNKFIFFVLHQAEGIGVQLHK
jgi:hypothetical protein